MTEPHAPNVPTVTDAQIVIGVLAILETLMMAGDIPPYLEAMLRERFAGYGIVSVEGSERELRQALSDLNHRFRYVLGEFSQPIDPVPVPPLAEY